MNEERVRILQMVAEGKVSPDEGSRLLEALEPDARPSLPPGPPPPPTALHVRLKAQNSDGDELTLDWPLGMVKAIGAMLPTWTRELCEECGFDLDGLLGADPAQLGRSAGRDLFAIHTSDGDELKIRVE